MQPINSCLKVGDHYWFIREARSLQDARNAISTARVMGSVGSVETESEVELVGERWVNKTHVVLADVVRLNEDGTECKPL